MTYAVPLIGGLAGAVALVLLVVIERRLKTIAADRSSAVVAPTAQSRVVSPEQVWERKLQVLEQRLDHLLAAIERLDTRTAQRAAYPTVVSQTKPPPQPVVREPIAPPAISEPIGSAAKPTNALPERGSTLHDTTDSPLTTGPELISSSAVFNDVDALLAEYRALIAHPRRVDITRWIDGHNGQSCEVGEGDVLQLVGKEAAAPLALVPISTDVGVVLPSGRTVVDFPTSYTDGLSLRLKTRSTFELEADGSNALRLIAPAFARFVEGRWRIEEPGRLAGFASA